MTNIITHRGIDAEKHHPYSESSGEAFEFFLKNGFGIEFDVQITKDNVPVISHDSTLERLSGIPNTVISQMTAQEFQSIPLKIGSTITLEELLQKISQYDSDNRNDYALHLKHSNQDLVSINSILNVLEDFSDISILIFDVKPKVAHYIKNKKPKLKMAASVAHDFDIERYNAVVGGTLLALNEVVNYKDLYDTVWLDEWDRFDKDGTNKSLYNTEVVEYLRSNGFCLSFVSPELHATSPHLLGGEKHQDANSVSKLELRWKEMIALEPDAICTDYPFLLNRILS